MFVRKYKDCSDLYDMLKHKLGIEITNPYGYPNISQFRRVEMFSRVLTTEKKEQVLSAFSDPNGVLQVVIATSAFGLGIDCQNIQRTIHWGLPSTIEEYVQESGRAGRDGQQAQAILYEGKVGKYPTMSINNYLFNNDVCRLLVACAVIFVLNYSYVKYVQVKNTLLCVCFITCIYVFVLS